MSNTDDSSVVMLSLGFCIDRFSPVHESVVRVVRTCTVCVTVKRAYTTKTIIPIMRQMFRLWHCGHHCSLRTCLHRIDKYDIVLLARMAVQQMLH